MTASGWESGPDRRGRAIRTVALGAAVALAAGFFAFGLTAYLTRSAPGPVAPTPEPASATPAATASATPSAGPTPESTASPDPEPGPSYDPPPLPYPQSWEEAEQWLEENALYRQAAVPTDCAIQRIESRVAPDLEVLDAHLARTTECLMQVWTAPMLAAGFVLPQPPVRSYDQPITTACGMSPSMDQAAAFYCPADQRIFYAVDRNRPLYSETPLAVDTTLAHELGHALQGRTGILLAEWAFQQAAENEDEALEYNRRTELQADCLAGIAMNALSQATGLTEVEREQLRQDNYARGDHPARPRTHGAPESGLRWISTGLDNLAAGVCNTFLAPAEDVA